jgi:hypothetical protein
MRPRTTAAGPPGSKRETARSGGAAGGKGCGDVVKGEHHLYTDDRHGASRLIGYRVDDHLMVEAIHG